MTCIAALVHEDGVYMAADTAGCYAGTTFLLDEPKVNVRGEVVMGFSGGVRVMSLIHNAFEPPTIPEGRDLTAFMAVEFCDALYEMVNARKALETDGEWKRESLGGALLVGVRGRLFMVDTFFACSPILESYFAVGSGAELALGALYAITRSIRNWDVPDELGPESMLELAVESAVHFDQACGGSVTVASQVVRTVVAGAEG
jgi:ATP-dependent protease HslVU (ClpYQ) peptidase subunit